MAALLSYVLGWITGLIFYLIEEKDEYVRFHAVQSIIFFGAVTAVMIVFGILELIPFIGLLFMVLTSLGGLFAFVMWIILMVKAYQGERFKLPIAGDLAEKYSAKR
ncbi:MAG TPA: DUF4870 domain-containing protein [Dehalococcoidia bacterium]|nr:DUF4870 domain-containing protein [Dehalococcoidia bacterium]